MRLALAVALAALAPSSLVVSAAGVGPIHGDTPVTVAALTKALPGYRATREEDESEGEVVGVAITLSSGKRPVLVVHGDPSGRLVSIEVVSPDVRGPDGRRVGDAFSRLRARGKLACTRGEEERSGELHCRVEGEPRVTYVGDVEELGRRWNGPDDEVPPAKLIDGMTIHRLVWTPG